MLVSRKYSTFKVGLGKSMIDNAWYILRYGIPTALSGAPFFGVPIWAWVFAGGVALWILRAIFTRPARKRFRATSARRRASRRQVLSRHGAWQKEALAVLKRIQRLPFTDNQELVILQGMSAYAFEYLITESLQARGAEIRKLPRASGDGGIDGMCRLGPEGRWHLIQAKRYAAPVSTGLLSDFQRVCQERRMPGLFVATGGFTAPARRFAGQSGRLKLLDGVQLIALIKRGC